MKAHILGSLLTCLFLASCIPVKLPPPESLAPHSEASKPIPIILSIRSSANTLGNNPILGSQYLFGILPLTAIRFQNSAEEFVGQVLIEELKLHGYAVILAHELAPHSIEGSEQPAPEISFRVTNPSLSAYDLIFLRRLSFQCTITLSVTDTQRGHNSGEMVLTVDEDRFEKFGFLPTLSNFAAKAIRSKLDPLFQELSLSSRRTARYGRIRESTRNP